MERLKDAESFAQGRFEYASRWAQSIAERLESQMRILKDELERGDVEDIDVLSMPRAMHSLMVHLATMKEAKLLLDKIKE